MKIFNWLHCKLQSPSNYSQVSSHTKELFGGDEKLMHETGIGKDTEKLLEHDILNEILTIGTLGNYNSLLSQVFSDKDDIAEIKLEDKEFKKAALVVVTNHETPVIELVKLNLSAEDQQNHVQIVKQEVQEDEKVLELPLLKEDKEKAEKRTTLADLFAADALNDNNQTQNITELQNSKGKQHKSYCKIEIQHEKAKSQKSTKPMVTTAKTTKKFQKLMMKMLRKKVHPVSAAAKGEMMKERSNTETLLIAAQLTSDVVSAAVFAFPSQSLSISVKLRGSS